jgi:hypothetical protein
MAHAHRVSSSRAHAPWNVRTRTWPSSRLATIGNMPDGDKLAGFYNKCDTEISGDVCQDDPNWMPGANGCVNLYDIQVEKPGQKCENLVAGVSDAILTSQQVGSMPATAIRLATCVSASAQLCSATQARPAASVTRTMVYTTVPMHVTDFAMRSTLNK